MLIEKDSFLCFKENLSVRVLKGAQNPEAIRPQAASLFFRVTALLLFPFSAGGVIDVGGGAGMLTGRRRPRRHRRCRRRRRKSTASSCPAAAA